MSFLLRFLTKCDFDCEQVNNQNWNTFQLFDFSKSRL